MTLRDIVFLKGGKQEQIYRLDEHYRVMNCPNYYNSKKDDLAHKVSLFWCAHYNVEKISKQINSVIKSSQVKISEDNIEKSLVKLCEFFSRPIKSNFKKTYPKESRLKNVELINKKQKKDILDEKDYYYLQSIFKNNNKSILDINKKRTLIMYFRRRSYGEEQVDYMEFSIMYYILDWYIKSGFSKVFTDLAVVSRKKHYYPHFMEKIFENFVYLPFTNEDKSNVEKFTFHTSIGANTIFFADGNYSEIAKHHSTPILSESINFVDPEKNTTKKINKYVLMKGIFYDRYNDFIDEPKKLWHRITKSKRERNTGDFYNLMKTVLDSVIELEELMIKDAKK